MNISDLNYLETISEDHEIVGGFRYYQKTSSFSYVSSSSIKPLNVYEPTTEVITQPSLIPHTSEPYSVPENYTIVAVSSSYADGNQASTLAYTALKEPF